MICTYLDLIRYRVLNELGNVIINEKGRKKKKFENIYKKV